MNQHSPHNNTASALTLTAKPFFMKPALTTQDTKT